MSALACTWLLPFLGKSAQTGDGIYQLTWQPNQRWKKQKLIITINWVVASDRRVHHIHSLLSALIRGLFGKEGSGEWAAQIATEAQPTVFIAIIFIPTQSWAVSEYWGPGIPGLTADGWVDCTAHAYFVSPYNRRGPKCTLLVRKALIALL